MPEFHEINTDFLSIEKLYSIRKDQLSLILSDQASKKISDCRQYLDDKIAKAKTPIYGVNTGFGSLCNEVISEKDLEQLQLNLVMSHACGAGDEVPQDVVRWMLFLKIQSLSYGHSGVQLATVNRLVDFYNEEVYPVVYQLGSLGASGDLAPLAHLSLPLLGMGEVYYKGEKMASADFLKLKKWDPIVLKSKEGLALLNGTQLMSAYALQSLIKAYELSYFSDLIATISLEAFDGRKEPFDPLVHLIRPHKGQLKTAESVLDFLEGSELINQPKENVQDPYSFRCIPQVHGASKDAISYAFKTIITEVNSVTDNPNVFIKEDKVISAGNFHGQPLALCMDHLAIALAELGNISERRTYQLISGTRGLPAFLVNNPGLNSGFMIPQYTAASIVSQNKQLCTPASIDSIVSSNGQEDHVSMGANAASKLYRVVENLERILSIELMTASQALSFRKGNSSPFIEGVLDLYREEVSLVENDVIFEPKMKKSVEFIQNLAIDDELLFF
jgi:histidine ammonia-lyase